MSIYIYVDIVYSDLISSKLHKLLRCSAAKKFPNMKLILETNQKVQEKQRINKQEKEGTQEKNK